MGRYDVSAEESTGLNDEIAAGIQKSLAKSHYGKILAVRGIETVALNDSGDIVEYRPDGSSAEVSASDS
jgi:hypothetical protein